MRLIHRACTLLLLIVLTGFGTAPEPAPAITQPIPLNQLQGFNSYPEIVQKLITNAEQLTRLNLTYLFGSADPGRKGMDCSGTIHYLLQHTGAEDIPRSANEIYLWVKQKGNFYTVNSNDFNSPEFSHLKPGDLLFWSGTYHTEHEGGISHVMIYLGKNAQNKPLMFGSSDGRTYQGKRMWGVSVFDFNLPHTGAKSHFVGYSCIPDLTCQIKF